MSSRLRQQLIIAMQARNFSFDTQRSYVRSVKQLSEYYQARPDTLSSTQIQQFILYLAKTKKLTWETCNMYTCGIRFFYRVVLEKNLLNFYIPLAKTGNKIPEILTHDEIKTLLAEVTLDKYRLIFMIMYSAGLRTSEAVKLTIDDIDSDEQVIFVRSGKGNKDRYAPLSNHVLNALRDYWKKYQPKHYLFPNRRTQQPLSPRTVREYFTKALVKTNIRKKVTLHSLRHSFATHLLEAGTDIINIKQCLGHASISSTVRYTRFSKQIIARVVSPFDQ